MSTLTKDLLNLISIHDTPQRKHRVNSIDIASSMIIYIVLYYWLYKENIDHICTNNDRIQHLFTDHIEYGANMKKASLLCITLLFSACTFTPDEGEWNIDSEVFSTDTCGISNNPNRDSYETMQILAIDGGISFIELEADCVLEKQDFSCGEIVDESPYDENNKILGTRIPSGAFASKISATLNVYITSTCDGPDCADIEAQYQEQIDADPSQEGRQFPCEASIDYELSFSGE